MQRIWQFLTNRRFLVLVGIAALAAFLFLGADAIEVATIWVGVALGVALAIFLLVWLVRSLRNRQAMRRFGDMLQQQADKASPKSEAGKRNDVDVIRKRMQEAITTIKRSGK